MTRCGRAQCVLRKSSVGAVNEYQQGMPRLLGICLCIFRAAARAFSSSSEPNDRYDELLTLRPLRDGKVFANFEFCMTGTASAAGLGVR